MKKRHLVKLIDGTVFTGKRGSFWDVFKEDSGFRRYAEVYFLKCVDFKPEDLEVSGAVEVRNSSIVFSSKYKVQG